MIVWPVRTDSDQRRTRVDVCLLLLLARAASRLSSLKILYSVVVLFYFFLVSVKFDLAGTR